MGWGSGAATAEDEACGEEDERSGGWFRDDGERDIDAAVGGAGGLAVVEGAADEDGVVACGEEERACDEAIGEVVAEDAGGVAVVGAGAVGGVAAVGEGAEVGEGSAGVAAHFPVGGGDEGTFAGDAGETC